MVTMKIYTLSISLLLLFLTTACTEHVRDSKFVDPNIAATLPKEYALSYLNNANQATKDACIFNKKAVQDKSGQSISYGHIDVQKVAKDGGYLYIVLDE